MIWPFVVGSLAFAAVAACETHRSLRMLASRHGTAAAESAGSAALFVSLAFIFAVLGT